MTIHPSATGRTNQWFSCLLCCLALAIFPGCKSLLSSDHGPLTLYPEETEIELGAKAYAEVLQTEPKSRNAHLAEMVQRVGRRIAAVSERPDFQWEYTLLAGPTQNAFCLPGGKVAIYEGILPVCQNEAGLAVVMSHEIAHALQRHGGERMSSEAVAAGGSWVLDRFMQNRNPERVAMMKTAYGLGAQYGMLLPFSRSQESEADSIGMNLMARAGYAPEEAPRFWERFSQHSGPKPPELLSTHPSDEHRAAELKNLVPRAMAVYQGVAQRHGLGEQIPMQPLAGLAQTTAQGATPVVTAAAPVALSAAPVITPRRVASPVATAALPAPVEPAMAAIPAPTTAAQSAPAVSALTIAPAPIVFTGPSTLPTLEPLSAPAPAVVGLDIGAPTMLGPTDPIQQVSAEEVTSEASGVTLLETTVDAEAPPTRPTPPTEIPDDDWVPHPPESPHNP